MNGLRVLALMVLVGLWLSPAPARTEGEGWLVAARRTEGQVDLWAMPASGGGWRRLTATPDDERWPAWHPDGHTLAFAARRDRNWDIYTLDLRTGEETRRTSDAHFEGWPAWSPDGRRLAFASAREGELDLFVLDLRAGEERNLTPTSPAHDWEPRWEDAAHLVFVSTRDGSQDLFRLTLADGSVTPLATTPQRNERLPQGMADGAATLIVAAEGRSRDLRWLDPDEAGDAPLGWAGGVTTAALAPDGASVAWLERRLAGDTLFRRVLPDGPVVRLNGPVPALADLAWGLPDDALMEARLAPLAAEAAPPPAQGVAGDLIYLDDLNTDQPRIAGRVLPSFEALRGRVAGELGSDFLGTVSETLRPIDFASDASDYLSWHKAGRALDTLLDLGWRAGRPGLEVVREDWHGDVYWRLWLRCPVQDGTCGEPLVEAPWDLSQEARWELAEGEGGLPKPFQAGYYVDFTRLAEDAGWERISSYETPGFDWRTDKTAMEFWHYQRTDGLRWYDAMREVYPPDTLDTWFAWDALRDQSIPRWILRLKGLPLPPSVQHAPAEIVIP